MSTYIRAVVAAKAIADKYGIPLGDLVDTFTDIPAADVAPVRRGRWIEGDGIQICSECGEEHEWEDYRAPYCDTCGAKMNDVKWRWADNDFYSYGERIDTCT